MDILVSIIVTSYNHAEYLDQRMESLLNQTYKNVEIIVIDDNSSDNSLDVLEKYKQIPFVTIRALSKNSGYPNACNFGVNMSNGEYIMFAECDDFSEPKQVEVLLGKLLENDSAVVAYSSSTIVDGSGAIIGNDFMCRELSFKRLCSKDTLIQSKTMQKFLLTSCVIPNMSAALIRKKYFMLAEGISPRFKACADWDFWCRLAGYGDFFYVTFPLNNFRTHMTTVRNTFDFGQQISEMLMLLYGAFARTELNWAERCKFRINIGYIIVNYVVANPASRIKSLPYIWRETLTYEKFSALFLLLGAAKLAYNIIRKRVPFIRWKDGP